MLDQIKGRPPLLNISPPRATPGEVGRPEGAAPLSLISALQTVKPKPLFSAPKRGGGDDEKP